MVGEADESAPGDQIGGGQDDFQPGGVGPEGVTRQVAQAGGLEFADAVFDAGVLTVPQLQAGDLPGHDTGGGVGDERGDSVNRNCAPGCGRSLRRISRVPAGQEPG